ncbi:MAG: arginase family protein [Promethearchaeota archaeon]
MKITLISVPFHLGQENVGMGSGPTHYLNAGIDQKLRNQGYQVKIETIQLPQRHENVVTNTAVLSNSLGDIVKKALKDDFFPFILGGNCNTCLGTLAGFEEPKPGIIWFDAHGDFNTPETTPSGFFDGMGLAIATGQCYQELSNIIENMKPIQESWTLHIGARDLDPEEHALIESTEVLVVDNNTLKEKGIQDALLPKITELKTKTQQIYLHIDIDVIDPSIAPGVDFPTPEGLLLEEIEEALILIGENLQIRAAALTAYNPENEIANKTLQTGFKLINTILKIVENQLDANKSI